MLLNDSRDSGFSMEKKKGLYLFSFNERNLGFQLRILYLGGCGESPGCAFLILHVQVWFSIAQPGSMPIFTLMNQTFSSPFWLPFPHSLQTVKSRNA
jgi:hypothetical protein